MVELQLHPFETKLSKDTYVSIRIGDAQKLSRANQNRQFRFSANNVGDRKFAKLEVFKRIGGCSLGITAKSDQELSVPLDDNSKITFKAKFKDLGALSVPLPPMKEEKEETNTKVQAAKAYLDKHNLEMRLSEAMQRVLRERPEDPAAFIAEKLMKSAETVKYVPREEDPAPTAPEVKVLPFPEFYAANMKQMKSKAFEEIYAAFPARAAPRQRTSTGLGVSAGSSTKALGEYVASAGSATSSDVEAACSRLAGDDRKRVIDALNATSSKTSTLTELVALASSATVADASGVLAGLRADVRRKLKDALIALSSNTPFGGSSFPALTKLATLASSATVADTAVALASLDTDVKKKLSDALIALGSDSPGGIFSSPMKAQALTLAELAALASSATAADAAVVIASLGVDVRAKLLDALTAFGLDGPTPSTRPLTLGEVSALATPATIADIAVFLDGLSADARGKLCRAFSDIPKKTSALAELDTLAEVALGTSPKSYTLSESVALLASSSAAETEAALMGLTAGALVKVAFALSGQKQIATNPETVKGNVAQFSDYYATNVKELPKNAFATIYESFPSYRR
mmetsp:Transcript_24173/g.38608  ORF Transcript_24173/g.38608 Transcript_24173/m.38608 type:complete len:579 (-) Transcript_24173:272-2008(-)|eukprot:CAMPEP_0169085956 /NCGR_PEP_ID=MMETSP1015-20121227/13439_1 /TAXON_ID=342587 /ORGANISM="Karlodinium micrum, Strain CCMP2283" /LENGTH=578 /DNA_ID=CAMNT_0009146083 /DNA_START=43 /DNA_END=1779 /DNA_ORIENTATION=-